MIRMTEKQCAIACWYWIYMKIYCDKIHNIDVVKMKRSIVSGIISAGSMSVTSAIRLPIARSARWCPVQCLLLPLRLYGGIRIMLYHEQRRKGHWRR